MRICFYAPFKPLGHPNPSGDLITARGLVGFFQRRGHTVWPASNLRSRWIYYKPWLWPQVIGAIRRISRRGHAYRPQIWLTYHTYYKAPDVLGPVSARNLQIPYVIFQGMYATKRRRDWRTWPGFMLNRRALKCAQALFNNRRIDLTNLRRAVDPARLAYIRPGIELDRFYLNPQARQDLRRQWAVGDTPVILTAAMFRADVKTEGIRWVIHTCARLRHRNRRFMLVLAGDGKERQQLQRLAQRLLPDCHRFVGRIDRDALHHIYSAADLFVFPGIRESLGMVYLEAQACGLPVVAFDNGGIPEVVQQGVTGFLTPLKEPGPFTHAVDRLLTDSRRRRAMGQAACHYVTENHNLWQNYAQLEAALEALVKSHGPIPRPVNPMNCQA